jgi:hypothetical protein
MPNDYAARVAQQIAEIKPVQSKLAVLAGRDGARAVINIGESTVSVPFVGTSLPPVDHPVQVEVSDGQIRVTGAAVALPPSGTITVAGDGMVATINGYGVDYTLPYLTSSPPAVGDVMQISWSFDGGIIQAKVTSIPTAEPPATNAPTGGSFHPAPFTATDSGSYGSRWFTNDVYSSASNDGAWFYGNKIRDSIPDNATITLARIYLNNRQASGSAPLLQLHNAAGKPGGTVSFIGISFALPARSGWVGIPLGLVDYLKNNSGGLGFASGGYTIFRGVAADGLSGALDIAWTTP